MSTALRLSSAVNRLSCLCLLVGLWLCSTASRAQPVNTTVWLLTGFLDGTIPGADTTFSITYDVVLNTTLSSGTPDSASASYLAFSSVGTRTFTFTDTSTGATNTSSAFLALLPPGNVGENDNLIFPYSSVVLDFAGISFTTSSPAFVVGFTAYSAINLFYEAPSYEEEGSGGEHEIDITNSNFTASVVLTGILPASSSSSSSSSSPPSAASSSSSSSSIPTLAASSSAAASSTGSVSSTPGPSSSSMASSSSLVLTASTASSSSSSPSVLSSSASATILSSSSSSSVGVLSASSSSGVPKVVGDPQFSGLLGQSYQVHGLDGQVYSLISDRFVTGRAAANGRHGQENSWYVVNARFVFLSSGRCPPATADPAADLTANCWSHPGSYLGEIGVATAAGDELTIISGEAETGIARVMLNGRQLDYRNLSMTADAPVSTGQALSIQVLSSHRVRVSVGNFDLVFANSDRFINILQARVLNWALLQQSGCHGLLGQTWRRPRPGKARQLNDIEGDVDDYAEAEAALNGNNFSYRDE